MDKQAQRWNGGGIEGEGGSPGGLFAVGNQEINRGQIEKGLHSGPATEYEAPPRLKSSGKPMRPETVPNTPGNQGVDVQAGQEDINKRPVYRTGPTIETAFRQPTEIEKKLGPEYIAEIKKYFEGLALPKEKIDEILKTRGLELGPRHYQDIPKKIREMLDECTSYLVDTLTGKYGLEKIENAVLADELSNFPEIKLEAKKSVVAYFGDVLEDQLARAETEEEKEWIKSQLQKLEPIKKELGIMDEDAEQTRGKAEKMSEQEIREIINSIVDNVAFKKIGGIVRSVKKIAELVEDIQAGQKKLEQVMEIRQPKAERVEGEIQIVSGEKIEGIIEHSLAKIKLKDEAYQKALGRLEKPKDYIPSIKRSLFDFYKTQNFAKEDLEESIRNSVNDRLEKIAHKNPIISEMLYLAKNISRGQIRAVDMEKGGGDFVSEMKERRRKQTQEIAEKEFNQIVEHELDNILARWSRGKNLSPDDVAKIKENYTSDKSILVSEITESILDGLSKSGMPFGANVVGLRSFFRARDKAREYAEKYLAERKNEKEKKSEFSLEQRKALDKMAGAVNRLWQKTLSESADWDGTWNEERVRRTFEPAAEALAEEELKSRGFSEELATEGIRYIISIYQKK